MGPIETCVVEQAPAHRGTALGNEQLLAHHQIKAFKPSCATALGLGGIRLHNKVEACIHGCRQTAEGTHPYRDPVAHGRVHRSHRPTGRIGRRHGLVQAQRLAIRLSAVAQRRWQRRLGCAGLIISSSAVREIHALLVFTAATVHRSDLGAGGNRPGSLAERSGQPTGRHLPADL